jgi:hypothetical protein
MIASFFMSLTFLSEGETAQIAFCALRITKADEAGTISPACGFLPMMKTMMTIREPVPTPIDPPSAPTPASDAPLPMQPKPPKTPIFHPDEKGRPRPESGK